MRTVAVLPVKRFARAKQRLRRAVDGEPRERLAAAMVGDVIDALATAQALEGLVVVTAEPVAAGLAREHGALVVDDPEEAGQSAAAALGVAAAAELGAERVLLVPGDTPALRAGELRALLDRREPIVIVPDRHGAGTNALLLAPPRAIKPSFGEDSRARHEQAARTSGLEHAVVELPSLMLDVDTPEDLAALLESEGGGARTRSLL